MTYFVYILGSNKNSKIITYVGYTNNLKKRLNLHNEGRGAKVIKRALCSAPDGHVTLMSPHERTDCQQNSLNV